ncbi:MULTISPECIES: hypothetical protein [Catenuloplanes]|uniref:Uncharacterized protein n=1 Tax=Catenuloplanes niger TaxID=587534 RepID=A0AAE3ZV38_9ACTN|nr:hypothetical protein [Catenuloplanes niger]MDR7325502.1 hypothetical protein [Catenuloplanes niger]
MTKDQHHEDDKERRVWSKIDLVKLAAGTLAAISSAVCASWLGVTGTIVGAALASVIATVGQELYAHSLKHTYQRLRGVRLEQALAVVGATTRVATPAGRPAPVPRASDDTVLLDDRADASGTRDDAADGRRASDRPVPARAAAAGTGIDSASGSGSGSASGSGSGSASGSGSGPASGFGTDGGGADIGACPAGRDGGAPARARFADRPDRDDDRAGRRAHWVRLGLATAAMFVFAMLAISAFELMAGDSLAGLFGDGSAGATTVPFLSGDGDPAPVYTPEPPISTVPVDPTTTATAPAEVPQTTASADAPATADPAPSSGTGPQPEPTTDPVTPPDTGGTGDIPAEEAPATEG